jgi:hypothetical protein
MIKRRDKEDNAYAKWRQQALDSIQALSGNRWTDFNAHDPGLTILEAALYALTEAQHHLQLPLEAYFKSHPKYAQLGLFSASQVAAPSIVTPSDYENLIRKSTPAVKNCRVDISENGRYRIRVEAEESADRKTIREKIFKLYHAHRNFCEALGDIVFEDKIAANDDTLPATDDAPQFAPPARTQVSHSLPKEYYSFQRHFPDTYGINESGAPSGSSPQRKAQILQLEAYLLIFDYLLANILHQARSIPDLLQLSGKLPPPYQPNFSIADMDKLIDSERFENNDLHNADFWREQKSRLLDVLDMLYGEDTKALVDDKKDLHEANEKRAELIRRFTKWNENRFRSFNVLKDEDAPEVDELIVAVFGAKTMCDTYWIEHILLGDYPEESNRLTLVQYAYIQQNIAREKWKSFIRGRLPAHLDVRFLWLDTQKMFEFWKIYLLWRYVLSEQDETEIALYGSQLHDFLASNFLISNL